MPIERDARTDGHRRPAILGRAGLCLALLGVLTTPSLALAGEPFRQGSFRPSLSAGGSSDGFGIGLGAAYCLVDGLELEAGVFHWFGSPDYTQVSPGLRYVLIQIERFHPYLGAFYRKQFVHDDAFADADFVGGRVGVFFPMGRRAWLGAGVGYERRLDCEPDDARGVECDGFFPELQATVAF